MTTGEKIKKRRLELGLTLEDVSSYIGVSISTVSRWEKDIIDNMKTDKIQKLSEILLVSVPYILGSSDEVEGVVSARLKTKILGKMDNMSIEQPDKLLSLIELMF